MADWQSFATGFLKSVDENYTKAAEKSEAYEDRLRELAERNKATAGKYELLRNNATNTVKQLRLLGVSEPAIAAAAESSATGLMDLQKNALAAVSSFKASTGQNPTSEDLAGMISISEELRDKYAGQAGKVDELISNLYGGPKSVIGDTKAAERGFFGGLFPPSKQDIRARLDAEKTDYGYSVYDLAELAGTQPYNPTGSGAYFSFQQPKFFDPDEFGTEATQLTRFLTRQEKSFLATDPSYVKAVELIALYEGASFDENGKRETPITDQLIAEARALRDSKRKEVLDLYVGSRARNYDGNSYIDVMSNTLNGLLPGYADSFRERAEVEGQGIEAAPTAAAAATEPEQASFSGPEIAERVTRAGGEITQDGNTYRITVPDEDGAFIVSLDEGGEVVSFEAEGQAANRREGAVAQTVFSNFVEAHLNARPASSGTARPASSGTARPASSDTTKFPLQVLPLAAPVRTMTPEEITAAVESGDIKRELISEDIVRRLSPRQRAALGYTELDGLFRITEALRADGGAPSEEQVREKSQQLLFKQDAKNNPDKLYVIRMPGGPKRRGFRESRVIKGSILAQIPDEALISGDINRNMISEYTGTPMEEYGDPVGMDKRDPYFDEEELLKFFKVRQTNEQE